MRDKWDVPYNRVADSLLLRDMCCRLRVHLQTYRRGTDQQFFDFYTRLYGDAPTERDPELSSLVEMAQASYPVRTQNPLDYYFVLCVSHAHRMMCNARLNEGKAVMAEATGKTTRFLEWSGEGFKGTTCQPQPVIIWERHRSDGVPPWHWDEDAYCAGSRLYSRARQRPEGRAADASIIHRKAQPGRRG